MEEFIRSCRLCKESMESSLFMMCPTCLADSGRVRNFIVKNPHVSVEEIASATNVPLEKVEGMVSLGIKKKYDLYPKTYN